MTEPLTDEQLEMIRLTTADLVDRVAQATPESEVWATGAGSVLIAVQPAVLLGEVERLRALAATQERDVRASVAADIVTFADRYEARYPDRADVRRDATYVRNAAQIAMNGFHPSSHPLIPQPDEAYMSEIDRPRARVAELEAAEPWQRLADALNAVAVDGLDLMPIATQEDGTVRDATGRVRIVWEPTTERFAVAEVPPVVAYRNPDRPGVLLCREHGDGWAGLRPLTSDDLPDGGLCTYGRPDETECGRDVLIPQQTD